MARKSVVRSEMGGKVPSMTRNAGTYGHNVGPFTKPQSMGNGGIPTLFFETMPGQKNPKSFTPTQTSGTPSRSVRPGTTQRKYGKSNA